PKAYRIRRWRQRRYNCIRYQSSASGVIANLDKADRGTCLGVHERRSVGTLEVHRDNAHVEMRRLEVERPRKTANRALLLHDYELAPHPLAYRRLSRLE